MAWTAPMTAVAGAAFPAADFNTYVRDNLMETAPEVFNSSYPGRLLHRIQTALGRSIESSGITQDMIATQETTTSTSYTDLTTVGPVATGFSYSGWILVVAYCNTVTNVTGTGGTDGAGLSYEVDGAVTSTAANDNWATMTSQPVAAPNENIQNRSMSMRLQAVTAEETVTVTCKYRVTTGQGWFSDRYLMVVSL